MPARQRHYELVIDMGEALGVASAIHNGRLGDLVEHLCIDHVFDQLAVSRAFRIITMIAIDNCRRGCVRCEQQQLRSSGRQWAG